jgi:hypothetical protein
MAQLEKSASAKTASCPRTGLRLCRLSAGVPPSPRPKRRPGALLAAPTGAIRKPELCNRKTGTLNVGCVHAAADREHCPQGGAAEDKSSPVIFYRSRFVHVSRNVQVKLGPVRKITQNCARLRKTAQKYANSATTAAQPPRRQGPPVAGEVHHQHRRHLHRPR